MPIKEPLHIIAIGASAGGLDEINSFFDHTPMDGVSYIIIQHLSADFKSRMVELLSRHSKLEVMEAEDGIEVACNKVYLIPNDKYMVIRDNKLHLTNKESSSPPHLTINTFFKSLAGNSGKNAIAVVFSGLGSDGTAGIREIKRHGGMVMARNPETSEFGSMPSNAIASGMVDFILEPEAMPRAIEDYLKFEGELLTDGQQEDKYLREIVHLISEKLPLDFSDYKETTILRRTKRRAAQNNFNSLKSYLGFLKEAPEELDSLAKEFLISVTAFFRDKEAFKYIKEYILPDIIARLDPLEELKIWVAGCATGEEVYSLAILLAEIFDESAQPRIVKIFATDIDSLALVHAGKGIYNETIAKQISPARLERFFTKQGSSYKVNQVIRKMVIFAQHDLVKNPPYCNMHLIACRNLLIYMTPILQEKIFNMFLFGLKKDGYLFLGSSENPTSIKRSLEVVNKKWRIYKNLESKQSSNFDAYTMPNLLERKYKPIETRERPSKPLQHAVAEEMYNALALNMDYVALAVNSDLEVLNSYGDTTKYFLPKHFITSLEELLPRSLAIAFKTLHTQFKNTGKKSTVRGIEIKNKNQVRSINLSISPLIIHDAELILLVFSENEQGSSAYGDVMVFDETDYVDKYTLTIEDELKELKQKLQASYEQIDASNENMQSFNEELISANEEMQSTNEEMQSVNEELHTINSDYQLKNKELFEINDDLNNYFRSNLNGQLFIDKNLKLMKFSPGTIKQINLLETDIGRPISNITTNVKFETIVEDIKQVLEHGSTITKEIETNDGKWYQVMTMPYIQQSDNKHTGAIVTFNDITSLKAIQQELDNSSKMLNMAIAASDIAIWVINMKTKKFIPTPRLKEMFGFAADDVMTYENAIAQIHLEHQPLVRSALEKSVADGKRHDIEFAVNGFRDKNLRWVRVVGNISIDPETKADIFTGVLHDITTHKEDELRKNDFIAMVSHELKSPITSLQAYLQISIAKVDKIENESVSGALNKALTQTKKMTELINGFLNVSSFEAGKIYLTEQTFKIKDLIQESIEEIKLTNANSIISMTECCDVEVYADRNKIGQVITNVLSNAVKYSPAQKAIEVSCKTVDHMLLVSISDHGIGIEKQDQAKLFDRYYRVENKDTKKVAGFGLGLYLCSEIIKRHLGKIWVVSESGKGSTFHFNLPLS
ncbi:MAG: CheR family methyltransferase [Daejeonella sp.]|uniref:CheR family methyltransferase n=1 Tax=Daejeonella sp. TaxID=2805397 RepID=UPI003C728D7F